MLDFVYIVWCLFMLWPWICLLSRDRDATWILNLVLLVAWDGSGGRIRGNFRGESSSPSLSPPPAPSPTLHWLKRRHIKLFITFQIKNVIIWFFQIINVRCCACSVATECSWLCQTFAHKKFNWCPCVLCFAVETVIRAIWSKIHIFLHLNINLKHGEVTCGDAEQEKNTSATYSNWLIHNVN